MEFFNNIWDLMTKSKNKELSDRALEHIKKNKKQLIEKYFKDKVAVSKGEQSTIIFMAGSPEAGKTEFSKRLMKHLDPDLLKTFVRIDADEIKTFASRFI